MTIDAEQFAAYLCLKGRSDNTIRNYRSLMVRWCDWAIAHDRDPHQPDPLAVRAWASQLHGSREVLAQARAMISHLCSAVGAPDVSTAIALPRRPRKPPRGLPIEEARALAQQAEVAGAKGTAALVGLYTAGRRSEIASLAWQRIDFDAGELTLVRPKMRDTLTVPMAEPLAAHLEERRDSSELWVFPGRHGGHVAPATIWQWILDVARDAGVGRVTPHQLRHTALTLAYDATKDLRAVMDLAGHTDPRVTSRYTATHKDALRAAVGSLNYSA